MLPSIDVRSADAIWPTLKPISAARTRSMVAVISGLPTFHDTSGFSVPSVDATTALDLLRDGVQLGRVRRR